MTGARSAVVSSVISRRADGATQDPRLSLKNVTLREDRAKRGRGGAGGAGGGNEARPPVATHTTATGMKRRRDAMAGGQRTVLCWEMRGNSMGPHPAQGAFQTPETTFATRRPHSPPFGSLPTRPPPPPLPARAPRPPKMHPSLNAPNVRLPLALGRWHACEHGGPPREAGHLGPHDGARARLELLLLGRP